MEGAAAWRMIEAVGAWRRVGMDGVVTGIDFAAATLRADMTGLDEPAVREIATHGELALLRGLSERENADGSRTT